MASIQTIEADAEKRFAVSEPVANELPTVDVNDDLSAEDLASQVPF